MPNEEKPGSLADSMRKKLTGEADTQVITEPEFSEELEQHNKRLIVERARTIASHATEGNWINVSSQDPQSLNHIIQKLVENDDLPLSVPQKNFLLESVKDEVFGFGPLGPLLRDPTVEMICVNNFQSVYVKREGRLFKTNTEFENEKHVLETIEKIYLPLGIKLDEANPIMSARLPNGARVEAAIPPASVDGPTLTITNYGIALATLGQMVDKGLVSLDMAWLLRQYVEQRKNVIISGPRHAGKSTLVGSLTAFIKDQERIISVEEFVSLRLQHSNWLRMEHETRQNSALTKSQLVSKSILMNPNRLILGECSGEEVFDLLDAWSLGTICGIATIVANSPTDCLKRLSLMAAKRDPALYKEYAAELVANSVHVIAQTKMFEDGSQRVTELAEVRVLEDNSLAAVPLVNLDVEGAEAGIIDWIDTGEAPKHIKLNEKPKSSEDVDRRHYI